MDTLPAQPVAAIVIAHDPGGKLGDYIARRSRYEKGDMRVEIRGECSSSCTIFTSLPKVCAGPEAVLGFHAPKQFFSGMAVHTGGEYFGMVMMEFYPPKVQKWIQDNGGLTEKIIYLQGAELRAILPGCGK